MSLPNVYIIADSVGFPAGPAGGQAGGGSFQQQWMEFTAPSLAAAAQVAYLVSSALQRPVSLVTKFAATPTYTTVVGAPAATALTSVPSGISY
jgi:hypothetical protein